MTLCVGLGGAARNACVTLCAGREILSICEQERVTRVRAAGFNSTGLPDEVLDDTLQRAGRQRGEVTTYAAAEAFAAPPGIELVRLERHFGHACAAFLPSPFEAATIVICDHEAPQVTVWDGAGGAVAQIHWPWHGPGFAEVYSQCAEMLGFTGGGREQRMEAMARLDPARRDARAAQLFRLDVDRIQFAPNWQARLEGLIAGSDESARAAIAAALQGRIADLLLDFLAEVKQRAPARRQLCVGGSVFYNSHFNSMVKRCDGFDEVFIPINPGSAGLSVGTALHASGQVRQPLTPFLGPSYSPQEIKATLDNCKLTYQWESETDTIALAVDALQKGRLVAWFDGRMEWGPRALGARSIIANPFAPYVLDNLNHYLKQRATWRGYALSSLESAVREHLDGPAESRFMECDYAPKDRTRFRHILPGPHANVRVHTVGSDAPPRFRALLQAFGEASGIPMLVNTSFNGFREPIVCSPRDAVRVFFGTGIDVLVLDRFVISK